MNGDLMPMSGHRRKADPKHAQKIKEGGKKAQKIAKETTAKHQAEEVPKAEEELLKDLEQVENNKLTKAEK
jgi:hypothetical protein